MYVCMYVCMYIYMYIYIYMSTIDHAETGARDVLVSSSGAPVLAEALELCARWHSHVQRLCSVDVSSLPDDGHRRFLPDMLRGA